MHTERLRQQLIDDMDRLGALIVLVARGERSLIWERDRLQDAVDIKVAILRGLEREEAGYGK